ncbi:MAG: glutamate formimidoyltransferase [Saprospiraceae bacterium]
MTTDQLIECVPNFSEGHDKYTIDSITQSIESVPGVKVLHVDMGYDAHRTVITFAGFPDACKEAAYRSILTAIHHIDMTKHHGAHPRIGAVDVFPFVPLKNVSMQEAIDCSIAVARKVASELNIPVYLYNHSAKRDDRKNLSDVRKGEYEGLAEKLSSPDGKPDFGPVIMNRKSGALIIGARKILVAFNINLKTEDVSIAKKIAKKLREKNNGLKAVHAIGWYMEEFKCAQVSTNLVDIDVTPLHLVFNTCSILAKEFGTEVVGSELVGLVPEKCLMDAVDYYLPDQDLTDEEKISASIDVLGLNSVKSFESDKQVIEQVLDLD